MPLLEKKMLHLETHLPAFPAEGGAELTGNLIT